MMKFSNILESMLLEATPDEIYNSYYTDIDREEFNQIVMSDPQSKINDNGIQRIGKYAKLLINLYRKKTLKLEDLPRAKEYLEYVYKHSISLDANKIKSLNDLYDVVKQYYVKDTTNLNDIITSLDEKEYRKVFQSEKWTIFVPLTEKASCYLGVNTEWCTTWGPQSLNPKHQDRGSMFARYGSQGTLYILIDNTDVNHKYQFHFESKQYMDKEDKRIDISNFLNENEDVKYFFFPSLNSDVEDENIINSQIDRMNALDDDDATILVEKIVLKGSKTNPLVMSIINRDDEQISNYITDPDVLGIDYDNNHLVLTVENLGGSISSVKDTLRYYQYEQRNGYEALWDRFGNEDSDYIKETLEESYFKKYFEENRDKLKTDYGYQDYEQFKIDHFDNFIENEDMWDAYTDIYVDKNRDNYENAAGLEVDKIEKYIDFEYDDEIRITIPYFLLFLVKKSYTTIDGTENLINDVLDEYASYYDFDYEFEGIWDHQVDDVKYEDMEPHLERYFDDLFENYEGVKKCSEYRKILNDTIQKVFKGFDRLENDEFSIYIPSMKINCEDGSINIVLNNKKTGKRESGPVKVENLASYATNYKLFENVMNFKNLLK